MRIAEVDNCSQSPRMPKEPKKLVSESELPKFWKELIFMGMIENFSFPHNYQIDLHCDFPQKYKRYYYPGAHESGKDGIWVQFSVKKEKWVGIFAALYPNAHSGVYSMPNPEYLCVVSSGSGIIINPQNPFDFEELRVFPVLNVIVHELQKKIVFIDFTRISVYSEIGLLWEFDHVSWDGIDVEKLDNNGIYGVTWNSPLNRNENFYLDLNSGEYSIIG